MVAIKERQVGNSMVKKVHNCVTSIIPGRYRAIRRVRGFRTEEERKRYRRKKERNSNSTPERP